MPHPARQEYVGDSRRLLLAFDIGTTFSGISYSILDPGNVPKILPVTRFPSQEQVGGDSKIPTVIYYDADGKVCSIGAQTLKDGTEADAEDFGWSKARWFKLHLRPKPPPGSVLNTIQSQEELPALPPNKTVVEIFADYMSYLHSCAKKYIEETHGATLWTSLEEDIIYVLTHPNGWGGPQQAQMRQAVVKAGLVADTDVGRSRVTFVTEGEASLHFCLTNGLAIGGDSNASSVLILDAGGGTIDLTAYSKLPYNLYEEIAIPQCHFQGAAYVTIRAEKYFKDLLGKSRFSQDVETLVTRFDRNTKHVFNRDDEPLHIQFTSHSARDPALNIRGGRITIAGQDVATFFEPSVSCIVEAIKKQTASAYVPITTVFLVGGFAASNWLFDKVREQVEVLGITVSRPDTHVNKAVADGAVSFYLDRAVISRVSRLTYGLEVFETYNPTNPEHAKREHRASVHPATGVRVLYGAFSTILPKNTRVKSDREFRKSFYWSAVNPRELRSKEIDILSYRGTGINIRWIDDPDLYPTVCTVKADTSILKPKVSASPTGKKYHEIFYDVILMFGLTELKAQIAYMQDGVEQRGPAQVIYVG
ncbi:hypothetical protein DFP72DRAFT_905143 [Ephemerocybe angulata]|uniref:Heat shock 70 kDa protein 12A n=1 Tax=Ephemerocybe angulata TaxID=980116 RepID=A0A8H6M5J0_9AGAR|nr:hypothetical protein DFP72DRAFT_905143 [Tulosesus angulatus]